jgi:predicted house-cleaning noncanonical NTP pyrophosphatase (MazG superfamily)
MPKRYEAWQSERVEAILLDLKTLLDSTQPDFFTPEWVRKNNPRLYYRIYNLRDFKGQKTWRDLISKLGENWQDKFKYHFEVKRSNVPLEELVAELIKKLEFQNPTKISPDIINDLAPQLAKKSVYSGKLDWENFIKILPLKWQKKWSNPNLRRQIVYQPGSDEFNNWKSKNIGNLHFLLSENRQDSKVQAKMLEELLKMTQAGNSSALNELVDICMMIISGSFESNRELRKMRNHQKEIRDYLIRFLPNVRKTSNLIGTIKAALVKFSKRFPADSDLNIDKI